MFACWHNEPSAAGLRSDRDVLRVTAFSENSPQSITTDFLRRRRPYLQLIFSGKPYARSRAAAPGEMSLSEIANDQALIFT